MILSSVGKWFVLCTFWAAIILTRRGFASAELGQSILKPIIVSAHRGGGRVISPDNFMPNIEYAARIGVTAVELDLRLTKGGRIVLWHNNWIPKRFVSPDAGTDERVGLIHLTLAEIQEIGKRIPKGIRVFRIEGVE